MYSSFYGFRDLPFELSPNPRYLLLTTRHREALANLQYGISARKSLTLLLGEAGTGKTTLVHAALSSGPCREARVLHLANPMLTRAEFVEYLARAFSLSEEAKRSKTAMLAELLDLLTAGRDAGVTTALVIDEAQALSHELLEEVRLLANLETPAEKLLPVVLAGQPELAERLNQPSLRQLKQRVALRCALSVLDLPETAAYIHGRIKLAGGDATSVFSRQAVELIHERSNGIPRTINVICDNALVTGFALGIRTIGADLVRDVCRDFDLGAAAGEPSAAPERDLGGRPASCRVAGPMPDESPTAIPVAAELSPDEGPFVGFKRRKRFSLF